MTTIEKISKLRQKMQEKGINAFIVFSADPHMSEYLPEEWQERTWLSGFTGSAGFLVVTNEKAALWTDGRYFVQAAQELENTGIELMKDGIEGTPNYIDWIISQTPENGKVAVNALATSHLNWESLEQKLSTKKIQLVNEALLKDIWTDRGEPSKNEIFVHPLKWAGQSVVEKLNDEAKKQMQEAEVSVVPYDEFFSYLGQLKNEKVLISPNCNQAVFNALKDKNTFVLSAVPGNLMKAIKNETELEGFRTVMVRDGVAMVRFLHWLKNNVGKEPMTEYSIGEKLREFRAEGENFVGESFGSIIGYKGNGAIVHYSAKNEGSKEVTNEGSVLVDSGGQYLEGTTDITRTLALGKVSAEFVKDCTLVLKGMINLSLAQFPKGTRGVQLDAIARLPLWKEGKDYAHGTGHGVGSFMNVHEGPQNIRKDMNPQELLAGMVCSNEPGFYVENQYGIRHENLVAVKELRTTEYGTFYGFETLTLCPFFKDVINAELLTEPEKEWLNAYHKTCEEKLAPHLSGEVKEWFLELVKPI